MTYWRKQLRCLFYCMSVSMSVCMSVCLQLGFVGIFVIGSVAVHCMHVLVNCAQYMRNKSVLFVWTLFWSVILSQCITIVMTLFVRVTGLVSRNRPPGNKNPWTDQHQTWCEWWCRGPYPHAKFGAPALTGAGLHMHEVVDRLCLFYTRYILSCSPVQIAAFDQFSQLIAQKTSFRVICFLCWHKQSFQILSPIFCKNTQNLHCENRKNLMDNNSSFVKESALMFAGSIGFTTDQMRSENSEKRLKWCVLMSSVLFFSANN